MKKCFLVCFVLFCVSLCTTAQRVSNFKDTLGIMGLVDDDFTGEAIGNVDVCVYDTQNNVVGRGKTRSFASFNNNRLSNLTICIPRKNKDILVKISADGYDDFANTYSIKVSSRERYYSLPNIHLTKHGKKIKEVTLDDVAVTASKVKMVMHGDTIVYNADAFQLSNGSMLDELIRRLPGVQLKGSQITVNGRFVSSLLVNGSEFFKGNPAVALQNLPSYTVKNLKVYEKQDELAAFVGKEKKKGENPLVMDVSLKRQYMEGMLANADLGYGTHDRWMARLFALRYTKASRIGIFANMNNVNDTRSPGTNGEWSPSQMSDGVTTQRSLGLDYQVANKEKTFRMFGNTVYAHNNTAKEQIQSGERFLSGGNIFERSRDNSHAATTYLQTTNMINTMWSNGKIYLFPDFTYYKSNIIGMSQNAMFNADPNDSYRGAALDSLFASPASKRLQDAMTNRLGNTTLDRQHYYDGRLKASGAVRLLSSPDYMLWETVTHINNCKLDGSSIYDLAYNDGTRDFRNKHYDRWSTDFDTQWEASYSYNGDVNYKNRFMVGLRFTYEYKKDNSDLFRLDKYAEYGAGSNAVVGYLPSTRDSLQRAVDAENTYYSRIYKNRYDLTGQTPRVKLPLLGMNVCLEPGLNFRHDRIEYTRGAFRKSLTRDQWAWEPKIQFEGKDTHLTYSVRKVQPELTDILDFTTTDNPLNIWSGNPNLRNTDIHRVEFGKESANFDENWSCTRRMNINAYWQVMRNAIGQSVTYDRHTGVTHSTPMNIDGNWNAGASFEFTGTVDKKKRLMLSTKTEAGYTNSVDYTTVEAESSASPRSSVRSTIANETLTLDYSLGKYAFGTKLRCAYLHAESPRTDFQTINTADVDYGVNATVELPLKLKLSTDLTLYSRYGYSDRSMNTNNLVWNARLERTFGKFTVIADGFDLFGKLSNVRKVINAQGRTETWYNTVPRYAMLHIMYKLHFKPKKK